MGIGLGKLLVPCEFFGSGQVERMAKDITGATPRSCFQRLSVYFRKNSVRFPDRFQSWLERFLEVLVHTPGLLGGSPSLLRPLHTAGCDCGRSCGGGIYRCDRLAADCCALQPIGTNSAFAGRISKSRRGHCHVRWSRGRAEAYRRGIGTWRIGKLLPGAFSPRRVVPQARQDR
jgi:hypothetical protein